MSKKAKPQEPNRAASAEEAPAPGSAPSRSSEGGRPASRPPGDRNQTELARTLLEAEAEGMMRKTIELANLGKVPALKLCLERLLPPCRERAIHLELPELDSIEAIATGMRRTIGAVAAGTITPEEGETVTQMLSAHSEVIKTEDLERRVAAVEAALASQAQGPAPERKISFDHRARGVDEK